MAPVIPFDANNTLGALQIGVLVSYVLFGVTTTQMYIYYSRFPDDSRKLKYLAAFVWVCEVGHVICLGYLLYVYTVTDFSHPEGVFDSVPKSLSAASLLSGIISACVHGFFSIRIYVFTNKIYIPCIIGVMAFTHLVGRTVICITSLLASSLASYVTQWEWLLTANWSISVACDFAITATLVVVLLRRRSHAHKKTAALVDKIIVWTIETGMLTSASSIVMLACFVKMKTNFVWLAPYAIGTRLFSNSFMASLNSRATLRAMNGEVVSSRTLSSLSPAIGIPSHSVEMTKVRRFGYDAEPSRAQSDKLHEHV